MTVFVIIIHVTVCVGLIGIVLIQRGRGGGLVESFSGVESMFGTRTSHVLTRATTIMSSIFFVTCLLLAGLSVRQSRSLMPRGGLKIQPVAAQAPSENAPLSAAAAPEAPAAQPAAPEAPAAQSAAPEAAQDAAGSAQAK